MLSEISLVPHLGGNDHTVTNKDPDVQVTKDSIPVVYHDFLMSETGIDAPLHTVNLEQVNPT